MFSFKDMVKHDNTALIDLDIFGERHSIEGVEMTMVVDSDILSNTGSNGNLGINSADTVLYVKTCDLPENISKLNTIDFDGRDCQIYSYGENMGISMISISQNRSRYY